jgi:hypothetical protein
MAIMVVAIASFGILLPCRIAGEKNAADRKTEITGARSLDSNFLNRRLFR